MNPNNIPYTPQEDEALAEMMRAGISAEEASRRTGRTVAGVKSRWAKFRAWAAEASAEKEFRKRWAEAYGFRAYPRYKVDQLEAPPMVRAFGADRMTIGGVASYAGV